MTDQQIKTRKAREADLPKVLEMIHALATHHDDVSTLTLQTLTQEAREWLRILVACDGADVVGYAALVPLAQLQFGVRGLDIHHLFVDAPFRQRGVGRALIKASIALGNELSCKYLTVGTHPNNIEAPRVYIAAGFEPLPVGGPRFKMRLGG